MSVPIALPVVSLPGPDAVTQVVTKVSDKLYTATTNLTSRTADFFNVFSPQLTPFIETKNVTWKTLADLLDKKIPVGSPISISGLAPPIGTELPTSGASVIPFTSPARFRWRIFTFDFTDAEAKLGTPTESVFGKFVEAQPTTNPEAINGRYQVSKGDLLSADLSIVPWPSTETSDDGVAPSKNRAFVAVADVSIWAPGFGRSQFQHPMGLVGIVESWASVLGSLNVPADSADGKLSMFGSLFQLATDTVTPELGKPTTLLIRPVEKATSVAGTVTQILETTPQINIQAGIDVGAMLKGLADNVGEVFGQDRDPKVDETLVNVGRVLSGLFSIPIAVDINGVSRTKTIIPPAPVSLSSIKNLPGSSIIGGNLPVGNLNTLIKTDLTKAIIDIKNAADSTKAEPKFLKNAILGRPGFRLIPLPIVTPIATPDKNDMAKITVSIPTELVIPGRPTPLKVNVSLPSFNIKIPILKVPQVALLIRAKIADFPKAENGEGLMVVDPYTSRAYRNTGIRNHLESFVNKTQELVNIFPREVFGTKVPPEIDLFASTLDGARRFLSYVTMSGANIQEHLVADDGKVGDKKIQTHLGSIKHVTGDNPTGSSYYSLNDLKVTKMSNVSTVAWFGLPDLDTVNLANSYRLRLPLTGEVDVGGLAKRRCGSLWLPLPGNTNPFFVAGADSLDVPAGFGYAKGQKQSEDKPAVEDGPEDAPKQVLATDGSWNDEPKYIEWLKGVSRS